TRRLTVVLLGLDLLDRGLVRLDLSVELLPEVVARHPTGRLEARARALVAADLPLQGALLALDGADPSLQAAFLALDRADATLERTDSTLERADLALEPSDVALDLSDLAERRDHRERLLEPGAGIVVDRPSAAVQPPLVPRLAILL